MGRHPAKRLAWDSPHFCDVSVQSRGVTIDDSGLVKLQPALTYFAQALTGFGGAMAALPVTFWANHFPKTPFDMEALLTLFAVGYISGYVANKLLPAIADNLYRQLTQMA